MDERIADLADRQHGRVARRQLVELGLGRGAIRHRLECGRLHRVAQGVYAVGHRVATFETVWMVAVLRAGPGAALSHRSAAALWGILPSARASSEVTVARTLASRPGLQIRCGRLPADEVTTRAGIPVTTVPRTILDLAGLVSRARVERAMAEAEVKRLTDPLSLHDLLERYPRRSGAPVVRAVLAARRADRTRSELELAFLDFLDRRRLPRPETNAWLQAGDRWFEADCVWRDRQLIVELDSRAVHLTEAAFESDRQRDRALSVAEWRPIRVTWRHLDQGAAALERALRALLNVVS